MWKHENLLFKAVGELPELVTSQLPVLAKLFDHEVKLICLFVNQSAPGAAPFQVGHKNANSSLGGLFCIMWSIADGSARRVDTEGVFELERQLWSQYAGNSHGGQPTKGHDRWVVLDETTEAEGRDLIVEIA